MDKQYEQLTPTQLLKHAKKHPHTHNVSTEAFSVNNKDYVVHNISMKGDPSNQFDVANYRRGLAFMEEIINFKEENLRVAKKGLRKFYDLIPEFLDTKVSYISTSKHFASIKNKLFEPLKTEVESYVIYSTEKANGQNAQISWDEEGQFWVIGSKNKTLLLAELKDTKFLTHKYQHIRTVSIAQQWFKFLDSNADKVEQIKQKLSQYSLVGQICDSEKSGHIVDYGPDTKLYFYALVGKNERQFSCQPPSRFLQFAKTINLEKYCVKFNVTEAKTYEALIQQLKTQMNKIYEGELQKYGEGTVVYITTRHHGQEQCHSVCKIKTLQYRIYRKLREKLKAYFEKYRKSYEKMLHKYIEEVKQLTRGFRTPKPEQYYFNIAKRAFQFCENQQKAITKFFHNKFISFLKMLQNQNIDKQAFKKIVHQDIGNTQIKKMIGQKQNENQGQLVGKKEDKQQNDKQEENKQSIKQMKLQQKLTPENKESESKKKKAIVFIPMTIPATGKTTIFKKLKEFKEFRTYILSSDAVRAQKMAQLMKKQKNLSKQSAFEKTNNPAKNQFYRRLGQILLEMEKDKQNQNYILFLDKNHPQNALKSTLDEIKKAAQRCKQLDVKIVCVLPESTKQIYQKGKYKYPFSVSYIACCLKRVVSRQQHQTLQGDKKHRANVCINFASMFRNFSISNYNISKYFSGVTFLPFTKQQQLPEKISGGILKVLLGSKPGSFDEHPGLEQLITDIEEWKNEQINTNQHIQEIREKFDQLFQQFDSLKVDVDTIAVKETKKQE